MTYSNTAEREQRVYKVTEMDEFHLDMADRATPDFSLSRFAFDKKAQSLCDDKQAFPEELFSRLHSGAEKVNDSTASDWEFKIHEMCDNDPSFESMSRSFLKDRTMASIATTAFLDKLGEGLEDLIQSNDSEEQDNGTGSWKQELAIQQAAEAMEKVKDAKDAMEAIGLSAGTDNEKEQARAQVANILMDSKDAAKALEMAGRMQRMNDAAKSTEYGQTVVDIETGGDLKRILPTELAMIGVPELKILQIAKIVEQRALQYKVQGEADSGKGDFFVFRDVSSSMNYNNRNAKAAAVTAYAIAMANKQNRSATIVEYNTGVRKIYRKDKTTSMDPDTVLSVLTSKASGGTCIETALWTMLEEIQNNPKSDVVVITDGHDCVKSDDIVKRISESESRLILIGIGNDAGFDDKLLGYADKVVLTDDSMNGRDFIKNVSGTKL